MALRPFMPSTPARRSTSSPVHRLGRLGRTLTVATHPETADVGWSREGLLALAGQDLRDRFDSGDGVHYASTTEQIDQLSGMLAARRQGLVGEMIQQRQAKERALAEESVALLAKYGVEYVPGQAARKPGRQVMRDGPPWIECSGTKFYTKSGECASCRQKAARPKVMKTAK